MDARVQVADLLAGMGRAMAEQALLALPHPLQDDMWPIVDPHSVWGDVDAWTTMDS